MNEQKENGAAEAPKARNKSEDTIIFTKDTPTCLDEKDAIHRIVEGLKYAASQAKELHARQPKLGWLNVHESLSVMVKSVYMLATMRSETRQHVIKRLDGISDKLSAPGISDG